MVSAVLRPVEGDEHIARYTVEIANRAPGMVLLERTVNGLPGLVAQRDRVTVMVIAFETVGDRITRVWAVRNPAKLRLWTA